MNPSIDDAVARVALLAQTYSASVKSGSYLEHGPEWDEERWSRTLLRAGLTTVSWDPTWGNRVTRRRLLTLWASAIDENDAAVAFFLTMVWGLGKHYLGPHRVSNMLTSQSVPELGSYLLSVRRSVTSDLRGADVEKLKGAYVALLGANINHLGPVYATKLLYVMSPANNRSPVVDVWVKRWGSRYGFDFALNSRQRWAWNADKLAAFASFCDVCTSAITAQGQDTTHPEYLDRGFVEYLVFWDSKYQSRRPWVPDTEFPSWMVTVDSR